MVTRFSGANHDFFGQFEALRREIDRAFDDAGLGRWRLPFSRMSFLPGRQARGYPLVNLIENEDSFVAEALAPGVDPASLNVSVMHDQLTLSGEKPTVSGDVKPEDYHRNERAAGRFTRSIRLPAEIDSSKVKAEYKNGLLLVTLPKAEQAKPKPVTVSAP